MTPRQIIDMAKIKTQVIDTLYQLNPIDREREVKHFIDMLNKI